MKFRADFLEGKCTQCLVENYKSIVELCSCGVELCEKHGYFHLYKRHVKFPVEIHKENDITEVSLKANDLCMIEGFLELLKCKTIANSYVRSSKWSSPCMHTFKIFKEMGKVFYSNVPKTIYCKTSACSVCLLQENRWLCIACGLVFCGRKRHDLEGNEHAYAHFEETEHCLFVNIDALVRRRTCIVAFCSFCGVFVLDEIINKILACQYSIISGCYACKSQESAKGSPDLGRKEGCKCFQSLRAEKYQKSPGYALAVIHAISYGILSTGNMAIFNDLVIKEENNEFLNSFNEILVKVFCMHALKKYEYIFVDHIEEIVNNSYERSGEAIQMDAARFFRNFLSLLKRMERTDGKKASISGLFYVLVRSQITCGACKERWERSEKISIIYLKPRQSVSEYFSTKQLDAVCKCGAKTKIVTSCLANTPQIIAIRLKRPSNSILGNSSDHEIEKEIFIPCMEMDSRESAPQECEEMLKSDLISSEVHNKMKDLFVTTKEDDSLDENANSSQRILKYTLRASVAHQNNTRGRYYFSQILDEREFPKDQSVDIESVLWNTFIEGKICKLPFFKSDSTLLFYVRSEM
ncbi:uncharacterized protein NEMAJ01_2126 [Nematocida major]|uniref:uncharacterized protein n=1 Tax=Nematocida major TaxID=1912982 RepID=UPI00200866AD|nr:uncharacterized protein NEMAJ01_2126 [Nematocida major]KAH9387230.1 hypothetical protein NEMAJ01_2126 [Nematocida major]